MSKKSNGLGFTPKAYWACGACLDLNCCAPASSGRWVPPAGGVSRNYSLCAVCTADLRSDTARMLEIIGARMREQWAS
jgi:hypothetical protein